MPSSVTAAFDQFMRDVVNLDPMQTSTARASRDWLLDRIHAFPSQDSAFPVLYPERDIHYGSFARRTKIRELDDIDLMIALSGQGATYTEYDDHIEINVPEKATTLKRLCHDGCNQLNSRKVINKFLNALTSVPQYQKAELKRSQEAAVLTLSTYPWTFDIVPCFFTTKDRTGRDYYLIPDGNGHWKKTDPRIDRDRVTRVNQQHDGNVLNAIRIMKRWNRRVTKPVMPSYLIETIIVDYYEEQVVTKASKYPDLEAIKLLERLITAVFSTVPDPKQIDGDINSLDPEDRLKISARAQVDFDKAREARRLEVEGDHRASISKWQEVFGSDFPGYESQ